MKKIIKKTLFTAAFGFLVFCCVSCAKKSSEENIVIDKQDLVNLAPDISWAVVTDPYAYFRSEMGWEASSAGYCKKGDILQVTGHSVADKGDSWFYFKDSGWLPEASLQIYSNKLRAQKAAQKL